MIRLETGEDFERVAQAFRNPRSKPFEWQVRPFGFCTICNKVTEYKAGHYGMEELGQEPTIECLKCRRTFKSWGGVYCDASCDFVTGHRYLTGGQALARIFEKSQITAELEKLNSRASQKGFLLEALLKFIARKKSERRVLQKVIHRLAALRVQLAS